MVWENMRTLQIVCPVREVDASNRQLIWPPPPTPCRSILIRSCHRIFFFWENFENQFAGGVQVRERGIQTDAKKHVHEHRPPFPLLVRIFYARLHIHVVRRDLSLPPAKTVRVPSTFHPSELKLARTPLESAELCQFPLFTSDWVHV